MPFKPRLVCPGDDRGNSDWSNSADEGQLEHFDHFAQTEFDELAAQLTSDAARLDKLYPAQPLTEEFLETAQSQRGRSRIQPWQITVAAGVLLMFGFGLGLSQVGQLGQAVADAEAETSEIANDSRPPVAQERFEVVEREIVQPAIERPVAATPEQMADPYFLVDEYLNLPPDLRDAMVELESQGKLDRPEIPL